MLARSPRFFFSEQPALQAVQKLLKEAQDKVQFVCTNSELSMSTLWMYGQRQALRLTDPF